jgi:hypothetical protein
METTSTPSGSASSVHIPSVSRERMINPIEWLFHRAAKTDPDIIKICSWWGRATQTSLGFFVWFTAFVAGFAMHYTLETINAPEPWLTVFAFAAGFFIFSIDREVVGSLDPRVAWARPLVAAVISLLVAISAEMFVLQDRVDQELSRQYSQNNKIALERSRTREAELSKQRMELQTELKALLQREFEWGRVMDGELVGRADGERTGVRGDGPVYENARLQQEKIREQISELRAELHRLENRIPAELKHIQDDFNKEEIAKVASFSTRYEAMQAVTNASPAMSRLAWFVTLFFFVIEMVPTAMKLMSMNTDYHKLLVAEQEENSVRIDQLMKQNICQAAVDPMQPEPSVAAKFAYAKQTVK